MSKFHLPEDYLKPGQEIQDEDGKRWKVIYYIPAPSVTLRNLETDQVVHGSIDSAVFNKFGFQVGGCGE